MCCCEGLLLRGRWTRFGDLIAGICSSGCRVMKAGTQARCENTAEVFDRAAAVIENSFSFLF